MNMSWKRFTLATAKPHIYFFCGQWRCEMRARIGIGDSPEHAYMNYWRIR